eukprot:SAG25_NODE_320_length_9927_cov_18.459402_11_plen_85_part_00
MFESMFSVLGDCCMTDEVSRHLSPPRFSYRFLTACVSSWAAQKFSWASYPLDSLRAGITCYDFGTLQYAVRSVRTAQTVPNCDC